MRIPGLKAMRVFPRWLGSRFVHRALILAYHRVAEAESDPYSLCVRPRYFAEQLDALREYSHPMSLSELVRRLTDHSLPRRAVAVTFDDGYADNLHNAKALLERYEIPATVFVVAGNVGREFWWDELDRLVPRLEALPPRLCMTIRGCSLRWERDYRFNTGSGDSIRTMFSNPRLRLVKALYHLLRPLSEEERKP